MGSGVNVDEACSGCRDGKRVLVKKQQSGRTLICYISAISGSGYISECPLNERSLPEPVTVHVQ